MGRQVNWVLLVFLAPPWALAAEIPAGKEFTNSLGMKLVRIEAGRFVMGSGAKAPASAEEWKLGDWDEAPAHGVTISQQFFLGAHEVTNAQYERFDPKHKDLRGQGGASREDDEPVTMVAWPEAVAFCRWLSDKEGLPYRLPTEAEWEYACRAGTTTAFHTGDALPPEQANIGLAPDGKKKITTMPVGRYKPNARGLYDMHGNVQEWCLDWYGPYEAKAQSDPVGRADGYARVTRGGSYALPSWQETSARYCRSSNRSGHLPDDANRCTGFRVVLGKMPKTQPDPPPPPPLWRRGVKQTPAPRAGPDPAKPYFTDFPGKRPTIPDNTWGPIFSKWNHFTALCVCPNGDVLAAWYTTVSESGRELALAASRLPAGSDRWQAASLFLDVPDVNDHAPVLLCDGRRIYHFSSQALRGWDDTSVLLRTSDDSGATWTHPRIILARHAPGHLSQSCSALAGPRGELVLAVDGDNHRRERLMVSRDRGLTWRVTRGDLREAVGRYAIHPAIAPLEGGAIVAFLRGPDPMPRLVSGDLGATWAVGKTPFGGIGVGQKAAAIRLTSGALLLCARDTRKPPLTGKRGTFAALSRDGGKSWKHIRHVPGVGGYMSAAQGPNGVIYLFGSRMSCAAFNEAWLEQGGPIGKAR